MEKQIWKPGNMLYPLPAVLVSVADAKGNDNLVTVAWTGTVCTNPPMVYISLRPSRYSWQMVKETGEFVINLTTERLARATDWCAVKSGRDVDKWKETGLTRGTPSAVSAPVVEESPVNIECRVTQVLELGSHHMFLAQVEAVQVDTACLDAKGKLRLDRCEPLVYSHGDYYGLGKWRGNFGYSVKKKGKSRK